VGTPAFLAGREKGMAGTGRRKIRQSTPDHGPLAGAFSLFHGNLMERTGKGGWKGHLHPRWQRLFLPTLIDVLSGEGAVAHRQFLVATHSPLVTASMETKFDEILDRLFAFELKGSTVSAVDIPWVKQGDVVNLI
jgi:hypothetical protein